MVLCVLTQKTFEVVFSLSSSLIQAVVFHLVLPRTVRHCRGGPSEVERHVQS